MSYPLGPPIRPEPKQGPEWAADDPKKPHIQRNVKTGARRNIATPPAAPPPYNPWAGLPVKKS